MGPLPYKMPHWVTDKIIKDIQTGQYRKLYTDFHTDHLDAATYKPYTNTQEPKDMSIDQILLLQLESNQIEMVQVRFNDDPKSRVYTYKAFKDTALDDYLIAINGDGKLNVVHFVRIDHDFIPVEGAIYGWAMNLSREAPHTLIENIKRDQKARSRLQFAGAMRDAKAAVAGFDIKLFEKRAVQSLTDSKKDVME